MPDNVDRHDFDRFIDRHDRQHSELDGRISRDMVPLQVYLADQRSLERQLTELRTEVATKADADRVTILEARPASTRALILALAGLSLTLLGIVVSAYFSTVHK